MPLRALEGEKDVNAWEHGDDAWADLKATYRTRELRMACCDHGAVPKTSKLGTHFFAHSRRGECTSAPETQEHLLAKSLIARAAQHAGWEVTTELRGTTPAGEAWIADVHAQKGNARVAFEVQWSAQTLEETVARQARYAASGVRALWLLRRGEDDVLYGDYDRQATPMFTLRFAEERFTVGPFDVPVEEFVQGALSGRLVCWPKPGKAHVSLVTARETCWSCGRPTPLLLGLRISHPQHPQLYHHLDWGGWELDEQGEAVMLRLLTRDVLTAHGLGAIKPRFSKTVGHAYLSQGCAHCDALQGDFFIQRLQVRTRYDVHDRNPTVWYPVTLEQDGLLGEAGWHFLLACQKE